MSTKFQSTALDRFRYRPVEEFEAKFVITVCPKELFMIHPHRVVEDVFVVFHEGRYHLVDAELYCKHVYVADLYRANLFEGMDIEGNRFLLISTYPLSGVDTVWRDSVFDVIGKAGKYWVEMNRIDGEDGYQAKCMEKIQHKPRWSKQSMADFVMEAFGNNVITAKNLPVELSGSKTAPRNDRSTRVVEEDFEE